MQPWGPSSLPARISYNYHGYAAPNPPQYGDCPSITIPPGGKIMLNNTHTIIIDSAATYEPNCTYIRAYADPFYASTTVFIYVVATTTTIAWMLFLLLLINQRSSRSNTTPKTSGWLQNRGVPGAIAGSRPVGGLGNRPWLQKAAAFLVTLGLTVAAVDTFKNAELQHTTGWNSARWMRNAVVRSTEIRILRVVSGVFVWLALVQTLIRLFPRRKEKLIIKWFGFGLILLDTLFSCLNSFLINAQYFPGSSHDAISALAYLFQLSINLLYAAWVSYYVVTQRRFAFFRADQLNMSIVALLAMISITIPVAFFIADISVPPVAAWGDFFRWVGGCAASVVVWEWVERIEVLEREEKRDGILGREVFDEDELSKSGDSKNHPPTSSSSRPSGASSSSSDDFLAAKEKAHQSWFLSTFPRRFVGRFDAKSQRRSATNGLQAYIANLEQQEDASVAAPNGRLESQTVDTFRDTSRPSMASGNGRASPQSTIYAVHYHPVQATPPLPDSNAIVVDPRYTNNQARAHSQSPRTSEGAERASAAAHKTTEKLKQPPSVKLGPRSRASWALAMIKRRKRSPPLEIKKAMQRNGSSSGPSSKTQRMNFKAKLPAFGEGRGALSNADVHGNRSPSPKAHQPTVIPAPPRGQAWSPDILRHSPVHLLHSAGQNLAGTSHAHPGLAYRKTPVENAEMSTSPPPPQDAEARVRDRSSVTDVEMPNPAATKPGTDSQNPLESNEPAERIVNSTDPDQTRVTRDGEISASPQPRSK